MLKNVPTSPWSWSTGFCLKLAPSARDSCCYSNQPYQGGNSMTPGACTVEPQREAAMLTDNGKLRMNCFLFQSCRWAKQSFLTYAVTSTTAHTVAILGRHTKGRFGHCYSMCSLHSAKSRVCYLYSVTLDADVRECGQVVKNSTAKHWGFLKHKHYEPHSWNMCKTYLHVKCL